MSNFKDIEVQCGWDSDYRGNEFIPHWRDMCMVQLFKDYAHVLLFDKDFEIVPYARFTRDCSQRDVFTVEMPYGETKETLRHLGYELKDSSYGTMNLYFNDTCGLPAINVRQEYWERTECNDEKPEYNQ